MVIYNRYIPFGKKYFAINLCGIVFAKSRLSTIDSQHERIHTMQQREMLFVGFFLWYVTEWLVRLIIYRNLYRAYRNISFEREAYANQHIKGYSHTRKHYAWIRYILN